MPNADHQAMIERYASGPHALRKAVDHASPGMLKWKPAIVDWSIHEVVIHCADSEMYAGIRIRLLAAEESPVIVGYNQEHWVRAFRYHTRPHELAFAVIESVRASTSELIASFGEADWSAVGTHTETGRYSSEDWLRTYSSHLHDHADQIRSNIEKWHAR